MPVKSEGSVLMLGGSDGAQSRTQIRVSETDKRVGPGTVRVGRFIGRLGVVSMPAIAVGLDLGERVVRRHVAKLENAGWLARAPWFWGDGSAAWLTAAGNYAIGLEALRPIKSPPSSMTMLQGIRVGWTAARMERRGRSWISGREMNVDRDRWAVSARCDRGITRQLPDLAIWVAGYKLPCAVIVESGNRRNDRQKMILEGWRDAIHAGRYARVQYDCSSRSGAERIRELAKAVRFSDSTFSAIVQPTAEQITLPAPLSQRSGTPRPARRMPPSHTTEETEIEAAGTSVRPGPVETVLPAPPPPRQPEPETVETAAAREEFIRELLHGPAQPQRRRRRR